MKRGFLHWFYLGVQFVMLAISIPKVATLFHAYDTQTMGPLIAGMDIRSWMVGIAIDLTATFTTWAAMNKYAETRKQSAMLAPGLIILVCTTLSVIANWEDAATIHPEQYRDIWLVNIPALIANPLIISAPPVIVLLLVMLVPSVLARPQLKSLEEIEAEAEEAEAKILAQGRIREAKARANAGVRGAQLKGLVGTVNAARNKPAEIEPPDEPDPEPPPLPRSLPAPSTKMTRTLWNAMPIKDRVLQSGLITPQEVADVLDISLSHARNLTKEVDSGKQTVDGRSGFAYTDLIDALYARRSKDSFSWARKLETTFATRKRRTLSVVPTEEPDTDAVDIDAQEDEA